MGGASHLHKMKAFCSSCGCHFPDEFEDTLQSWCGYWWNNGLFELPKKYKKMIWDWQFSLPVDEIAKKTGIILHYSFSVSKNKYKENEFERNVKYYKNWPDKKRKEFQKNYFKFFSNLDEDEKMKASIKLFFQKNKEWKKNNG
jgi:hypothetical protein